MGAPGCPEFARWIASIARVRIALTHKLSIVFKPFIAFFFIPSFSFPVSVLYNQ
jgi:hypothetical protein